MTHGSHVSMDDTASNVSGGLAASGPRSDFAFRATRREVACRERRARS